MGCLLSFVYSYLPFFIIVALLLVLSITQRRKATDLYQKSFRNQEEMINLLREIRDALKK